MRPSAPWQPPASRPGKLPAVNPAPDTPVTLDELRELASGRAASEYGPLAARPFLLLDAGGPSLAAAETRRLADWLRALPCPSLCVGGKQASRALLRACDVVLREPAEAAPLAANIRRNPIASAVLVQLLRAGEKQGLMDALFAESLAYATLQGGAEYRRWLAGQRAAPAPTPPADPGPPVLVERDGATLRLELNRPSNRNAISVEIRDALVQALQLALADPGIRRIELRGRGKCFSTGGDLAEFGTVPDPAFGHAVRAQALPGRFLALCADRVEARVHSACIGAGAELPAFARRVVASKNAFFHLPELSMGLIPGAGGTVSLPRRIGRQRTAWLALSGKRINAMKALEWGLVDAIEP